MSTKRPSEKILLNSAVHDFVTSGNIKDKLIVFTDDTGHDTQVVPALEPDLKLFCSVVFEIGSYLNAVAAHRSLLTQLSTQMLFSIRELKYREFVNPQSAGWKNQAGLARVACLRRAGELIVRFYAAPVVFSYLCAADWRKLSAQLPRGYWDFYPKNASDKHDWALQHFHHKMLQTYLLRAFPDKVAMLVEDSGIWEPNRKLKIFNSLASNIHDGSVFFFRSEDEAGIQLADITAGFLFRVSLAGRKHRKGIRASNTDVGILRALPEGLDFKSLMPK